jgi:putative membrane protein
VLALAAWAYFGGVAALWGRAGTGRGVGWRQIACFSGGLAALLLALVSPLDALSSALFSAHMVQHLLLMLVAAPLLVLGRPLLPFLWALPPSKRRPLARWWKRAGPARRAWRAISAPAVVWVINAAALWLWHLPGPYQAALRSAPLHAVEHVSYLGTALLFWWTLAEAGAPGRLSRGAAIVYTFAMAIQGGVLGALLTFSAVPWYPFYGPSTAAWGLTPLEDQQLAGLIMWIPASLVYLAAVSALLVAWFQQEEAAARRREARSPAPGTEVHADAV